MPPDTKDCKKFQLASVDGVPELKTEWTQQCNDLTGICIDLPQLFQRTSQVVAYAEICGPADLLEEAFNDIKECALLAATAAVVAAIFSDGAAAASAFEAVFEPCIEQKLEDRAAELTVSVGTDQESGEWHPM